MRTTSTIPVDLNTLMFHLETTIVRGCAEARDFVCVTHCVGDAVKRAEGINRYLWNNKRRFQKDMKRAVNFMDKLLTLAVVTTRSRR